MILFFDTETTGFPSRDVPLNHVSQPWIVQLAALLTEDDGTERAAISFPVRPEAKIPAHVAAVHGITTELAQRAGVGNTTAVAMWDRLAQLAEMVVAHRIEFDWEIMQVAWARARLPGGLSLDEKHGHLRRFCTMEAATPVVNIPPTEAMLATGRRQPKAPKLAECIQHFFGEELVGAHDALVDVRACARVYFRLRQTDLAEAAR